MSAVLIFIWICLLSEIACVDSECNEPVPMNDVLILETQGREGPPVYTVNADSVEISLHVRQSSFQSEHNFNQYFEIRKNNSEYQVHITQPIDLDNDTETFGNSRGSINLFLTFSCWEQLADKPVTYTRYLTVSAVDEFAPTFMATEPFEIREDTPTRTKIADLQSLLQDLDSENIIETYNFTATGNMRSSFDQVPVFRLFKNGIIVLVHRLDYDIGDHVFFMNVSAKNHREQTANTILTFLIKNVNDCHIKFVYFGCFAKCANSSYSSIVSTNFTGVIEYIKYGPIQAIDNDGDRIQYKIIGGSPVNYERYLTINKDTGALTLIAAINSNPVEVLDILIEAMSLSVLPISRDTSVANETFTSVRVWIDRSNSKIHSGRLVLSSGNQHYKTKELYVFEAIFMFITAFHM